MSGTSANLPAPDYHDAIMAAAASIRSQVPETPQVALVLGSGLGDFAARVEAPVTLPYERIPGWPVSRVVGHGGHFVAGRVRGRRVAVLAGRSHYYEGHDGRTVTFSTRVLGALGVRTLILTNAAGGIDTSLMQGALMVIDDHINLMGVNPLLGPHDERLGTRFPDMTEVYSRRLRALADEAAAAERVPISHGVYVALAGPSYETPAEIRYLRLIGGDAVGMSTVPEAIVARQMDMEVLGISCITNMAAGIMAAPLDHQEVLAAARRVRDRFVAVLEGVIERL
jgi:purine-nucleoside phosphorylase